MSSRVFEVDDLHHSAIRTHGRRQVSSKPPTIDGPSPVTGGTGDVRDEVHRR